MKINFLIFITLITLTSCLNQGTDNSERTLKKLKERVISISEDYVRTSLSNTKKTVSQNGTITIGDSLKRYIIDPSKIFTGYIDDDLTTDAIVTVISFKGDYLDLIEHLIILNTNGKLMLIRSIESDMTILKLDNRIITAELPTRPRTSPLFYCSSCREIVNYEFKDGDLIRKK
ncbi:MAG: hypothetical protein IPH69_14395 [Bacteroidales bacterium]|nr:hypothetical protein [Bacteroidales bacterium]MBK7627937.1 hypothetical protein [Bacteroidales bacterium]